jgi:hypothetical protein
VKKPLARKRERERPIAPAMGGSRALTRLGFVLADLSLRGEVN